MKYLNIKKKYKSMNVTQKKKEKKKKHIQINKIQVRRMLRKNEIKRMKKHTTKECLLDA